MKESHRAKWNFSIDNWMRIWSNAAWNFQFETLKKRFSLVGFRVFHWGKEYCRELSGASRNFTISAAILVCISYTKFVKPNWSRRCDYDSFMTNTRNLPSRRQKSDIHLSERNFIKNNWQNFKINYIYFDLFTMSWFHTDGSVWIVNRYGEVYDFFLRYSRSTFADPDLLVTTCWISTYTWASAGVVRGPHSCQETVADEVHWNLSVVALI